VAVRARDRRPSVDALLEHGIEDLGLKRRNQEARGTAIPRRSTLCEQFSGLIGVVALAPEPLLAVSIRHPARHQRGEALANRLECDRLIAAQHDFESIAAQVPGLDLVGMATGFEHHGSVEFKIECALGLDALERKPLTCDGVTILATGITHVPVRHPARAGEFARNLLRRPAAFLDEDEGVIALPRGFVERFLDNAKIFGRRADAQAVGRRRVSACDRAFVVAHA